MIEGFLLNYRLLWVKELSLCHKRTHYQPNVVDLKYFKLWIKFDKIILVWNVKGLNHLVLKIKWLEGLIWRLNFFDDLGRKKFTAVDNLDCKNKIQKYSFIRIFSQIFIRYLASFPWERLECIQQVFHIKSLYIFLLVLSMLSLIYVYDLCLYFLVRIKTNKAVILCYCLTHIWRETVKYIYISIKIYGLLILTMDYIMFRPKVEMHWWIMSL